MKSSGVQKSNLENYSTKFPETSLDSIMYFLLFRRQAFHQENITLAIRWRFKTIGLFFERLLLVTIKYSIVNISSLYLRNVVEKCRWSIKLLQYI